MELHELAESDDPSFIALNFILAAWDELRGTRDPMTNVPPNTIVFKRNLDPAVVALTADGLIQPKT